MTCLKTEEWTLSAPINDKTGHPCAPSRQLLVQWVVQAWEKIPTDLIKKAWTVSGYKKFSDLEASNTGDIVQYSPQELGTIIENLADDNFVKAFQDEMNDPDPEFPFMKWAGVFSESLVIEKKTTPCHGLRLHRYKISSAKYT